MAYTRTIVGYRTLDFELRERQATASCWLKLACVGMHDALPAIRSKQDLSAAGKSWEKVAIFQAWALWTVWILGILGDSRIQKLRADV